jgi:hypothetical protein
VKIAIRILPAVAAGVLFLTACNSGTSREDAVSQMADGFEEAGVGADDAERECLAEFIIDGVGFDRLEEYAESDLSFDELPEDLQADVEDATLSGVEECGITP